MRDIRRYDSLPSTMPAAAQLAAEGATSGTVVVANEQTAGEGRLGRSWYSEKDAGLYFSIVLRLPVDRSAIPAVTLALGLAVREAVLSITGVKADLRWPNDLLARDRKFCGILTQIHNGAVIAGVGINVNHTRFPADISPIATSLRIEEGFEFDREKLLAAILTSIDEYMETFVTHGKEAIFRMFSDVSTYAHGKRVIVEQADGVIEGTTEGVDESGFLIVRTSSGERRTIVAGGVRAAGS